jgi:4-diphosphocytidyl-2-C-methyl-D-erythritol kinase
MIAFPNAKINIGLHVTEKRDDGYHSIESVFYPLGLTDAVEVVPHPGGKGLSFTQSGIPIPGETEGNLCLKAFELISREYALPPVKIHLHKHIPIGAGLGGGSSDGAFFIRLLNDAFELGLAWGEMHHYAKQLGSDCSFFISNRPAYVTGRGDQFESMAFSLKGYHLVLVAPPVHINTAEAYSYIKPMPSRLDLESFVGEQPPSEWKGIVVNDFESSLFAGYPELGEIRKKLDKMGALYSSITGSGSAVYGLFEKEIVCSDEFPSCFVWQEKLAL